MGMNQQIQETKLRKQSTFAKAQVIAASRSIRRYESSQGPIWCVESESTRRKFYCVQYIGGELMCDCPAFLYGMTNPCKHQLSVCLKETA